MAKKDTQSSRKPTRRQVALSRKEREQKKLIYMALGLVGALILIVLAVGLIQTYVIAPGRPAVTVNGQEISVSQYQDQVRYERFVLDDQYQQVATELNNLPPADENDQLSQFLRTQYQQFAQQVLQQRSNVDRQAVDDVIRDILVEEEATRRGITVSEDEITQAVNRFLAGRQGGYTAGAVQETSTAAAEASATAALWTPTPTFTPSPTLTATNELTPTATPANTPVPPPTATPNIISDNDLAAAKTEWLQTVADVTGLTEAEYREFVRKGVLRTKVREALEAEVSRNAEQANARHILVETEEEAKDVLARLEAGEDFGALAEELSQDPGSAQNGGELGFVPQGRFVQPVEEAVFSLPVGQLSEPVESQFGWHIIEVLAREERELSPADYSQVQQSAFSNWEAKARQNADIQDLWTVDMAPPDSFPQPQ